MLRKRSGGLTLVEVLVALAILALLSVLAYRALDSTLRVRDRVAMETERWRELSYFFDRLHDDVDQVASRGPRSPAGLRQAAWKGGDSALDFASFGQGASPLRHVHYRWRDGAIELLLWPAFDAAPAAVPEVHAIVRGVRSLRFSYLNRSLAWVAAWPPQTAEAETPRALRIDLVLDDGAHVDRIFALP